MKTRSVIITATAVLALIAVLAVWRFFEREPEYNGRPLSYWLDRVLVGDFTENPMHALKAIGPPAAPPLVHALTTTDSPRRRYYTGLRSKLPASLNALLPQQRLPAPNARNNAFSALCFTGAAGKAQVPELIQLLRHNDKQVRIYATLVLAGIGPDAQSAIPSLQEAAAGPDLSGYVAEAMRRINPKTTTGEIK